MREVQQSFFLSNLNKITRNYNSKAQGNTPVLNTIFSWFDADGNGTFNDEEWSKKEKYAQELQQMLSSNYNESTGKESSVVKFYRKQLDSKLKEIKQIDAEAYKIYEEENYYTQMLDFEKAHGIERCGYTKKAELPDNAVSVDMSMFEMGAGDEKTYEKGYVKFPDDISDDDKNTYLKLLKNAQKQGKQLQKSIHKWSQLEKEYESAIENYNKAQNGQITKIGSQVNSHQEQAIRESSNPYYEQYKHIEQEYNALRLKNPKDLSLAERNSLIQLPKIMKQLEKMASLSVGAPKAATPDSVSTSEPVSKSENGETVSESGSNGGLRITNAEEKLSYNVENEFSDEHSLGFIYPIKRNWEVSLSGGETEKYRIGEKPKHEGFFKVGATYTKNKYSITSGFEFSETDNNRTLIPRFSASYNDNNSNSLQFTANRAITTVKESGDNKDEQNTSGTTYSTGLELEWQKMLKNEISANLTSNVKFDKNQGNEYELSVGATTPLLKKQLAKHNLAWSGGVNFTGSYYDSLRATIFEPGVSTSLSYNNNDFTADVSLNENVSIISAGGKTIPSSLFTASGAIGYKQLSFNAGYNSTQNAYIDMTSVNAGVSYLVPSAGTFSFTGSMSNTTIGESGKTNNDYNISLGYSAPLDKINGWFKKIFSKNK